MQVLSGLRGVQLTICQLFYDQKAQGSCLERGRENSTQRREAARTLRNPVIPDFYSLPCSSLRLPASRAE